MKKLLFIDSKLLIDRYNQCLESLGIEPTQLTFFHIGKSGWSPEIADEKDNPAYLHHSDANIYGIIISSEQRHVKLERSLYSFFDELLNKCFDDNIASIRDITTLSGIIIDFENSLTRFHDATDLLLINDVHLKISTPKKLGSICTSQINLHTQLKSNENAWMDGSLHNKIIESATEYGDLRFKKLYVEVLPFSHLDSFFTELFGGVCIFKDISDKPIMFLSNKQEFKKLEGVSNIDINLLTSKSGLKQLFALNLICFDDKFNINNINKLANILDTLLARSIFNLYADIDYNSMTDAEKKKVLVNREDEIDPVYYELEKYIASINSGTSSNFSPTLQLKILLAVPCEKLLDRQQNIIKILLTYFQPNSIYDLFEYNIRLFEKNLLDISVNYKLWIGQKIKKYMEE